MPGRDSAVGEVAVAEPAARHRDQEPVSVGVRRSRAFMRSPLLWVPLACVALAALSAAVLPTVPSYDPWSWIVWGRALVDPHLSFITGGGPSWKPLPVMFTTVFALFGGAAPTLWVIAARAGGLLGLVAACRLAWRLVGRVEQDDRGALWVAGAGAGVVAVLGLILTQDGSEDWVYYMFRGTSEPMLIGAALWAIELALARRHALAFLSAVALGLMRPEAWPFLGLYALWLWFKQPRLRVLIILGLLSLPLFWFVPPWIGSGQPFLAASHAREYNGHLGADPVRTALARAFHLQVLPVLIAAAVAIVWGWWSERDRLTLALAGGALAWVAVVVVMVADGYPGLQRFFLPAAAIACVLAGVGVARVGLLAAGFVRRGIGGAGSAAGARGIAWRGVIAVVAVALIGASVPLSSSRIDTARAQKPLADQAVQRLDQLTDAVRAVGGHGGVYPCRSSVAAINHGVQTALAWKLHVTLNRVATVLRVPGLDFIGPHDAIDGGPAPVSSHLTAKREIARVGAWRVVAISHVGVPDACVGR